MDMFEKNIKARIRGIFPDCAIKGLKDVSTNPDTDLLNRTVTYEVKLRTKEGQKRIFVKKVEKGFIEKYNDYIQATIKMGKKSEAKMLPRIYGFFPDIQSFVYDGAEGVKLNKYMLKKYFHIPNAQTGKQMEYYMKEVAKGIAFVQNDNKGKNEQFSYKTSVLDNNPQLKDFIKGNSELVGLVDSIEGLKQRRPLGFNDFKASHVFVAGKSVKFIDFCPVSFKWFFINPVAFSVSLELAQKAPFFRSNDYNMLRKAFYDEYIGSLKWKVDPDFLEGMEMLKRCELLVYFRNALRSGAPLRHKVSMKMDMKILLSRINEFQRK